MKKRILISLVVITVLAIISTGGQSKSKNPFNLTKPQKRIMEIEGKKHSFLLYKYDPPYLSPPYLLKSKEEADCSTPEGTDIALCSAVGRNKDWYLSLHDESGQKLLFKHDERSGGRVLEEYDKGKPLPDPLEEGNYAKFLYKVEFRVNNKKYTIIHSKEVFDGEEENYPSTLYFVKQDNVWLATDDLAWDPLTFPVGTKRYDELLQMSHRVMPIKLIFILVIVILIVAFFVIRLILKRTK